MKILATFIDISDKRECSFNGCGALTDISLPNSLRRIERMIFDDCKKLRSVNFETESQLIYMGYYIFKSCESMIVAEIPSKVANVVDFLRLRKSL